MNDMTFKKCKNCGAVVHVLKDCNCADCGITCCGESMVTLVPNTEEASAEKHVPVCEKVGDNLSISVNHVMEEEHFIPWIFIKSKTENRLYEFKPGEEAKVTIPYEENLKVYAYCNKHGLWMSE